MANYYTQFSCILDVGSLDNAVRAREIRLQLEQEVDAAEDRELGFEASIVGGDRPGALWIHSDESGDPADVIKFVLRCAEELDLTGVWGFCWALTCSKARLDGFGGGAQLIDLGQRRSTAWIDCEHWLAERLAPASPEEIETSAADAGTTDAVSS